MKLVCRDCQTTMVVNDKRLKICPQCRSSNVEIILNNIILHDSIDTDFFFIKLCDFQIFPMGIRKREQII